MPAMTKQQIREFLTTGKHIMKLATLTPEGWPYIVPVWYDYDGEAFSALGRPKSRWVAHIENDSRASICVDTTEAPYKRVIVQGNAKIADMQFTGDWENMAHRYMGEEMGHRYYEDTKHIPRVLVRVIPNNITTWAGPGWHPRYEE